MYVYIYIPVHTHTYILGSVGGEFSVLYISPKFSLNKIICFI